MAAATANGSGPALRYEAGGHAPFPPAPRSAERIDELNITRTWRFQPNNVLQTR